MAEYRILFRRSVGNDLEHVPKRDLRRILERIGHLSRDPRPPGCEKLAGQNRYRVRQGDYRIVYSVQDGDRSVWVVKVGHRRDVYDRLTRRVGFRKPATD
jgi:mRNA interferase RelE/StbE